MLRTRSCLFLARSLFISSFQEVRPSSVRARLGDDPDTTWKLFGNQPAGPPTDRPSDELAPGPTGHPTAWLSGRLAIPPNSYLTGWHFDRLAISERPATRPQPAGPDAQPVPSAGARRHNNARRPQPRQNRPRSTDLRINFRQFFG